MVQEQRSDAQESGLTDWNLACLASAAGIGMKKGIQSGGMLDAGWCGARWIVAVQSAADRGWCWGARGEQTTGDTEQCWAM
jgi:hypothetical protein